MNIKESLNKKDIITNGEYDLLNYYNSLLFTSEQKQKLTEMLERKSSAKELYKFLESVEYNLINEDNDDVSEDLVKQVKNFLSNSTVSDYSYTVLIDTDDDNEVVVRAIFDNHLTPKTYLAVFKEARENLDGWSVAEMTGIDDKTKSLLFYPPIEKPNESLTEAVEEEKTPDEIEYEGWYICPLVIDSIKIGDKEYEGFTRYLLRRKSDDAWLTDEYLRVLAKRAEVIKEKEDEVDTVDKAKQIVDYINDRVVVSEKFTTKSCPKSKN